MKPSVTNEGTGVKPGVLDMTEEESTESEAESWGKDKDDSNNEHDSKTEGSSESDQEENEEDVETDEEENNDEFVKTPSNDTDDEDETKSKDKTKGDEDEGMDYTTNQFDDDVDFTLNEPVTTDEGFIQKEEDAHVTLSTVPHKTEVPVTSSSYSSDLASKFLNFLDIPYTVVEIVSPMDVHVHHEDHRASQGQLPQILPKEVSNFAPSVIKSMVTESLKHAVLAKESSQPKSTYEAASSLIEFKLKKILIDKIKENQSYLTVVEHIECYDGLIKCYDLDKSLFSTYDKVYSLKRSRKDKDKDEDPSARSDRGLKKRKTSKDAELTTCSKTKVSKSGSSKGAKSQLKSSGKSVQSEEPEFEVADLDMPQDQEENPGNDDEEPKGKVASKRPAFKLLKGIRSNYSKLEYDFEECYKALLEKLDWNNPEGGDYPFDLTKPLPLVMNGNRQIVAVDYFFNNDLKYLQGGILTMTYTTSITKTKVAQYDLPGIKDMVPTFRVLLKLHMINMHFGVFLIEEINVRPSMVMHEHVYGYLRDIEVRRADNDLYIFKEDDFPRLLINDIEDMLLLIVQNRLTNLLSNDVSDFAIALRMFTKSMVIQKRVEDLQLGVKSYQKKINVTKPETTRPELRNKDPYTPYQDPQGFIYVNNKGRNRLMRSDELYKFSDRTLTGLQTSLDDITKNIRMEYLPQRI
ncbi:hypothetical protein Tco_1263462 [Tanacetum coccineum]